MNPGFNLLVTVLYGPLEHAGMSGPVSVATTIVWFPTENQAEIARLTLERSEGKPITYIVEKLW